nr:MAG TPA: AAA domain protein [Caudoviricetes sp.]
MAIKKPAELDFSNKKFMCIISGQPGLGKTTLALSAPSPFLFDADNGIARVRAEQRGVTSVVESYEEVLGDMESDEYKAAESVVIDTGGMLVQLMKDWAKKQDAKAAKDGRAMYGVIKTEFDRLCYQIRSKDKKHLIVVFHTTEQQKGDTIQTRLACEGSTKDIVWTPADFGGYMYMMGNKRMIGFTPTDEYFAKGCFGVHGVMQIPELAPGQKCTFLTDLFKVAQEKISEEAQIYSAEKAEYDKAMQAGKEAIQNIKDPFSAQLAADAIGQIHHALTSKAEIKKLFLARLKELGLKYDKEKKAYVLADAKPAE